VRVIGGRMKAAVELREKLGALGYGF